MDMEGSETGIFVNVFYGQPPLVNMMISTQCLMCGLSELVVVCQTFKFLCGG